MFKHQKSIVHSIRINLNPFIKPSLKPSLNTSLNASPKTLVFAHSTTIAPTKSPDSTNTPQPLMAPVPPVKGIGGPGKVPLYGAVPLEMMEPVPVGVPVTIVPVG